MATLQGTLALTRVVVSEVGVVNGVPRSVVAGTSASIQSGGGGQTKIDELSQSGQFRSYGNGNTRLILGSNTTRTQTFALMAITETDVTTLTNLLGHTVCYRTPGGQKYVGAFLDLQISRLPGSGGLVNVGLVLQSVTYSEAV